MFVRIQIDPRPVLGIEKRSQYSREENWNGALGQLSPLPTILSGVFVAVGNLEIQALRREIFFRSVSYQGGDILLGGQRLCKFTPICITSLNASRTRILSITSIELTLAQRKWTLICVADIRCRKRGFDFVS